MIQVTLLTNSYKKNLKSEHLRSFFALQGCEVSHDSEFICSEIYVNFLFSFFFILRDLEFLEKINEKRVPINE